MVKYKPILLCLMLAVLLTSCFNDSASESNGILLNSIIVGNSSETDSKQSFSFNSSLNVFDNNYSYKVNCQNGKRTFQYSVPIELIPESGLHTFQAIAIPADAGEDLSSYSTPKTRVQIS